MEQRDNIKLMLSWLEQITEELYNNNKLSRWEDSFITSISDQLNRGKTLTERQFEIFEGIYARTN